MPVIEQIAFFNTWAIRHAVLSSHLPFEKAKLPDDETGIHFGLFENNKLIAIASTFTTENQLQFRKVAVLPEYQHRGYGTQILQHIISFAKQESIKRVWCNARLSAAGFYAKYGFIQTPNRFINDEIEFVVMELILD